VSDRIGAKFLAAEIDLEWGRMLAERRAPGDTEKGRDLLTKARAAATAHGYAYVERRAADELKKVELINGGSGTRPSERGLS
jgi:hypothetical protein